MRRRTTIGIGAALLALSTTLPDAIRTRRAAAAVEHEERARAIDIAFLTGRVTADPDNWLLAGHLADLLVERFRSASDLADIERAERLIRATQDLRTEPAGGLARLSAILLAQHRFDEAYDAALRATAGPAAPDYAWGALVDAARAFGEYEVADSALARIPEATFGAAVRTVRGTAEDRAQRAASACRRLEERAAMRDLRAWCITRVADLERIRGPRAFRRRLEEALAVRPGHRGALEMQAELAYAYGDWKRARELYLRIRSDAHPDLHLRLAEVDHALGRTAEAAASERRFLEVAADPAREALFGLPLALYRARAGDCAAAARILERERARRHSTEATETGAWVQWECGDTAAARRSLDLVGDRITPTGEYLRGLMWLEDDSVAAAARIADATADPTRLEPHAITRLRGLDRLMAHLR